MNGHRQPDAQRLLNAHTAATEFYRRRLQAEPRALTYLRSRGIIAATAHTPPWTIGYAPRGWTHLRDHLRQDGYTDPELLAAGLATTTRTGHLIDVFRNRVMFPIRTPDGQVIAFTGRDLSGRPNTPKYCNTATTAIYSKKHTLYGMAEQLGGDTQPAAVMLVEGPTDVVAIARLRQSLDADQYRQPYVALAPCGTALTAEQVTQLVDAVPPGTPLVVAFDADNAGRAAIEKSYELLHGWPGPVDAVALPAGADPAELVAQGRASAAHALQQARRPLPDLLVDQRLARFRLDEIPGRFSALRAAAPLIADIATHDIGHAARLSAHLASRLDLNPLTVHEAVFPPAEETTIPPDQGPPDRLKPEPPPATPATDPQPTKRSPLPQPTTPDRAPPPAHSARAPRMARQAPAPLATTPQPAASPAEPTVIRQPDRRIAIPLGGPGFPDPQLIGHQYARTCPPETPAATWVHHDPTTGHTAWVLAEGTLNTPGDRYAAALAAEITGRTAVLVGAHKAIVIARRAVNAHFTQPDTGRGDAAIAVLTTLTDSRPAHGPRHLVLAWAGDITAYGSTGQWFAPLTTNHTTRGVSAFRPPDTPVWAENGPLTASVRGGPIGVNRIQAPLTQIVLAGRTLAYTAPETIRRAVEWRKPSSAIEQLRNLGGPSTVALAIRPRPDQATRTLNAAQLARQDQPSSTAPRTGRLAAARTPPCPDCRTYPLPVGHLK